MRYGSLNVMTHMALCKKQGRERQANGVYAKKKTCTWDNGTKTSR